MIVKKKKRKAPEINAGSMADIAFLLLIFFLVTTTIDQETGLQRKLPEKLPPDAPPPEIKKRNVFEVLVNSSNQLLVNGEPGDINLLKDRVKEFIMNPTNDPEKPEKRWEDVDLIGRIEVSKGVISLQNDRLTTFEKYMEVQDVLTRAFNELRDDLSQKTFGIGYLKLVELAQQDDEAQDKMEAIQKAIPMAISEAEPNRKKTN